MLLLADQLFLMAHDDRTGRSRLHPRVTGLGLAAALVGELALAGRVGIVGELLYVQRAQPPDDPVAREVLTLFHNHDQHRHLRLWLAFLARDAVDRVGGRLVRAGVMHAHRRRTLTGAHVRYLPADERQRGVAAWEPIRLAELLTRRQLSLTDGILTGLMTATALTRHVLWDPERHREATALVPHVVARLPQAMHDLVAATEAAVGAALSADRR